MYKRELDPFENRKDTEVFIHLADLINEIAEAGLAGIIAIKQKEEFRKQKEAEMHHSGEAVPEDRTPTNGKIVEPRLIKLEKGKELQGVIDNCTEIIRFLVSIVFALASMAGDVVYAIHKKFVKVSSRYSFDTSYIEWEKNNGKDKGDRDEK